MTRRSSDPFSIASALASDPVLEGMSTPHLYRISTAASKLIIGTAEPEPEPGTIPDPVPDCGTTEVVGDVIIDDGVGDDDKVDVEDDDESGLMLM